MKLALFIVLALIVAVNGSIFSYLNRKCECKAVSDTVHFPFHSWKTSSCKLCSCNDPAMSNCEASCRSIVENYAKSGCGKLGKGTKVKFSYEAEDCKSGYGSEIFTCV